MIEIRGDKKVLTVVWLSMEESFRMISATKRFSMPARSFVRSKVQRMITRWFL